MPVADAPPPPPTDGGAPAIPPARDTAGAPLPLPGWSLAAVLAIVALAVAVLWLAGHRAADRAALSASRLEAEFAAIETRELRQQLEAERILSAAQLARLRAAAFPEDTQLHAFHAMDNTGRLSLHLVACAVWSPALGKGELHFTRKWPSADRTRTLVLTVAGTPGTSDTPGPRLAEFAADTQKLPFTTPPGTPARARFFIHEIKHGDLAPVAAGRPVAKPENAPSP
ncbi:MAG: hypothetical protein LBI02_04580 [Opitutaceae bacterium]|jgi:hypothetical protein|nr:hypothetical protein [Opitutaceae bacterium]